MTGAGLAQQPGVKELPIVEKPRERSSSERVTVRSVPAQPSKGVLAVVLDPVIAGRIIIKDSAGRVINDLSADKEGQAEIQLPRNKIYSVEASFAGYLNAAGKSKPLKTTEIIRLRLIPQFARLALNGLPANAQVIIDNEPRATADQNGVANINDLKPGDHSLLIRHPEYNDYADGLKGLVAGAITYWRISPIRVALLTIQGPAGATVLIDGAVQGKINADGTVRIDYELDRASEHIVTVELLGYQTSSRKETLAPGARALSFKLDPIVTSAGVSDFFVDSLAQWNAPPTWKLVGDARNRKLRVEGLGLGLLKDKTYRDIQEASNFTIWLDDGKGATWAVRADREGRNYYLFHLAGPKSTTHTPKRFYTYLVKDGVPTEVSTAVPVSMDLNQKTSYTINFAVTGYTVRHWITSNETGQKDDLGIWTDTTPTKDKFLFGTFGFRSMSGEIFSVDDFNLEPATSQ